MPTGRGPKKELDAQDARTAEGSYWDDLEIITLRDRFGSIPEARRKALDALCDPIPTEAGLEEHERQLVAEFERRIEGLAKEEADKLYHAWFTPDDADGEARCKLVKREEPKNELEREYVEWRTDFNVYKDREIIAAQAVNGSRENETLSAEIQGNAKALAEASKDNEALKRSVRILAKQSGADSETKERRFLDEGASYRIVMPEGEFTVKKDVGSQYLHWFARNPRDDKRALVLVAEVRGNGVRKVAGDYDDSESPPLAGGEGVNVDAMTTMDILRELRERLRGIKSERDRAEEEGNQVRLAELNVEATSIEERLRKDTKLSGMVRQFANEDSRAQGSIGRALNRCYARIEAEKGQQEARKAFVEHFRQYLSIAYTCRYDVPMEQRWITVKK